MCAKWINYCDTLPPHDRFLIDFRTFPDLLSADERGTRLERTATQEKLRLILDKSL